ncbi:MAG TPA: CBS domain-containing protein [Candidatus Binatia bacterium]|jgi:acetoin utilization protein AcuB
MSIQVKAEISPTQRRQELIEKYWAGDMARKVYLVRRQRKAILEHCRRIAVIGASADPDSESYVTMEKLLGLGLEIIPIFSDRESFLGLRCYARLRDVPGRIDIVQVYPDGGVNFAELAKEAVEKGVSTLWIEKGMAASKEVEDILSNGKVQLVEYESLELEYLKHTPMMPSALPVRKEKKAVKVKERMTRNPTAVTPEEALKDAVWKMEHGHFRHLPVVDSDGKLIGMLSDRDIRLIRPSLAFVSKEDAMVQLWSLAVQQAAVFDPISVKPETSLKEAAELMLRWHVGGLPVADDQNRLVGVITYTDLLREYIGREEDH